MKRKNEEIEKKKSKKVILEEIPVYKEDIIEKLNNEPFSSLKEKAELISIETEEKTKETLVKELGKIYILLENLPMDLKILIISFIDVETSLTSWFSHEIGRVTKKYYFLKNNSFYRDMFGYSKYDVTKKAFFLFHTLHIIDQFIPSPNHKKANIEMIKILAKYTSNVHENLKEYLYNDEIEKYLRKAKLKIYELNLRNSDFKKAKLRDLTHVKELNINICFEDDFKFPKLPDFPVLNSLKIYESHEQTNTSEKLKEFCINIASQFKLKSLTLDLLNNSDLLISPILKTQNQLKSLEIYDIIEDYHIFNKIIDMEVEELKIHRLDMTVSYPIWFPRSLHFLTIGVNEKETKKRKLNRFLFLGSLVSNIIDLKNIYYLEILGNYSKIDNEVLEKFLQRCDQHKIGLKFAKKLPTKVQKKYKNIIFF